MLPSERRTSARLSFVALLIAVGLFLCVAVRYSFVPKHIISGYILEGCSCKIPCPCNVGKIADPVPICETLAFFRIAKGQLDGIDLQGLQFAVASRAGTSSIIYVDGNLSPAQRSTCRKLAAFILSSEGTPVFQTTISNIQLNLSDRNLSAHIGSLASLSGEILSDSTTGRPVTVRHPKIFGSFPFVYAWKGRTTELTVISEPFSFHYSGTNLNRGYFEVSADKLNIHP